MENILNLIVSFFKKYKDAIYISAIVIVITILFIVLHFKKETGMVVNPPADNHDLLDTVNYLKTENGRLYAHIKAKTVEVAEANARADSIAKELKIKPKFIKGEDVYIYKTDTVFKLVQIYDSLSHGNEYMYTDNYADLYIQAPEEGPVTLRLKFTDTLTRVEKSRTNIFGTTTTDIYIRNANPYNTIKYGYSFIRKEKRTWLTIGPSIQVNPFTRKADIGISIQVPIIQFKR